MEMSINQKIEWVKDLLDGQYRLWNRDIFYIPINDVPEDVWEHFSVILEKFEREGLIKKTYLGYAGLFNEQHIPEVFNKFGEDGKIPTATVEFFESPKKGEKNPKDAVLKGKYKSKTIELLPTYYIEIDVAKLNASGKLSRDEVEYLKLSGEISYRKNSHSFQENNKEKLRQRFFNALWDERKIIRAGKEKIKGLSLPPGTVAARMELVESKLDFDRSPVLRKKLSELIKNLKTTLRLWKMPVTIRKAGGIQIIVEIK